MIASHTAIQNRLSDLVEKSVDQAAPDYMRGVVGPLLEHIRNAPAGFGGEPDMRSLLATLPDVFDEMDDAAIVEPAETALIHVSLIGRAVATPKDIPVGTARSSPFFDEDDEPEAAGFSADMVQDKDFRPRPRNDLGNLFGSKVPVTSTLFDTLKREQRARAFRIAGINKATLINRAMKTIEKGLRDGLDGRDIQLRLQNIFAEEGVGAIPDWHFRVLMRQNLHSTYNVAQKRVSDAPLVRDAFPYRQYLTVGDRNVRPTHAALNGLIFAKTDPFWNSYFPPWGWNCRCTTRDVSQAEVDRKGGNKKIVVDNAFVSGNVRVAGQATRGISPDPEFDFDRDQLTFLDAAMMRHLEGRLRDIVERFIRQADADVLQAQSLA